MSQFFYFRLLIGGGEGRRGRLRCLRHRGITSLIYKSKALSVCLCVSVSVCLSVCVSVCDFDSYIDFYIRISILHRNSMKPKIKNKKNSAEYIVQYARKTHNFYLSSKKRCGKTCLYIIDVMILQKQKLPCKRGDLCAFDIAVSNSNILLAEE